MGAPVVWLPSRASAFLTPPASSYLCFESSKSGSSKRNKVIKLVDITDIQKVGAHPSCHAASLGAEYDSRIGGDATWRLLQALPPAVFFWKSRQSPVSFLPR